MMSREVFNFNDIIHPGLKAGLTADESLFLADLCGQIPGVRMNFMSDIAMEHLIEMELITPQEVPTHKARFLFKKRRNNADLAKTLRMMYPPGMKDNKWPWRGTNVSVTSKLDEFFKMFPDIEEAEVIRATTDYLERFDDDARRSLLIYFILKNVNGEKKSILADYVIANRESPERKSNSNFDQL